MQAQPGRKEEPFGPIVLTLSSWQIQVKKIFSEVQLFRQTGKTDGFLASPRINPEDCWVSRTGK
jgi:hypothetical protein